MATPGDCKGGPPVYGHGFLPGTYQPTFLRSTGSPMLYLTPPAGRSASGQRDVLDMSQELNRDHLAARVEDVKGLSCRIATYGLAYPIPSPVPHACAPA